MWIFKNILLYWLKQIYVCVVVLLFSLCFLFCYFCCCRRRFVLFILSRLFIALLIVRKWVLWLFSLNLCIDRGIRGKSFKPIFNKTGIFDGVPLTTNFTTNCFLCILSLFLILFFAFIQINISVLLAIVSFLIYLFI